MGTLKMQLLNKYDKPVFLVNVPSSNKQLRCLLDTGADTPVFTLGENMLKAYFPDAELIKYKVFELCGFGKETEIVPMYMIPNFKIENNSGKENYIEYKKLYVACCHRPEIRYPLILSATMFSHMNYSIYNVGVDARTFEVVFYNDTYSTGIISIEGSKNIQKIYSFEQERY